MLDRWRKQREVAGPGAGPVDPTPHLPPSSNADTDVVEQLVARLQAHNHDYEPPKPQRNQMFVRLRPADVLPEEGRYGEELLPGLRLLASIDHPNHVSDMATGSALDEFGGWLAFRAVAVENLRALPTRHVRVWGEPEGQRAPIDVFDGEDHFVPSRLLIINELLVANGIAPSAHGLLVIVPNQHVMAVHVLDGPDVVLAVEGMINLARAQVAKGVGALSPELYYRAFDGRVQQVTMAGENGATEVRIGGAIAEAFAALGVSVKA